MANAHYHELLWEYLYGLLDPAEAEAVRAHVETCAECRAALTEAEGEQRLLARAARVVAAVPVFSAPGQEQPAAAQTPAETLPEAPTLPLPAPRPRQPLVRRYWPAWPAAAALLAAAIGLNELYQHELSQHEVRVAQGRKGVEAVEARFAALTAKLAAEKQDKVRLLKDRVPLQVQVLGPAQVQPGAPVTLNLTIRDQDGKLRDAEVTTDFLDAGAITLLARQVDRIQGTGAVQTPPLQKDGVVRMIARAGKSEASIEEPLRVAEPTHASHLALSKSVYHLGEVLFFRTLTLDRYSLKPPSRPVLLRFTLLSPNGQTVGEMTRATGPGGVSGGEMAVTTDLVSGNYTFHVAAADGNAARVLPQQQSLEIIRETTPQIELDRYSYMPGDKVGINFRAGPQGGTNTNAAREIKNITLQVDNQSVPRAVNQATQRADNAGNLNFEAQLPQTIKNKAEIIIDMHDGKKDNKLVQTIPIISSERTIDFFPEGGDLVAGAPSRVYYRVRSPQGEPAQPDGRVIILAGKTVLESSEFRQGVGSFTFTPDPKETYSVRILSQGTTEIANPFQRMGIRSEGLVLHAPKSVSREDEPLELVLRNQGAARRLFLETACRGQIVDQRYLDLQPGSHPVRLQPAPRAAGVLRVTACEVSTDGLAPVAERLLYRIPQKRLDVSCQITNGPGPYAPGTEIKMKVKAADEQKRAGQTWMLAAVVDEKYRAEKQERSLAAHFYLAGDFAGDELDNANLVLNDTPASWQALDLFLGTQGWRRFVRGQSAPLLALQSAPRDEAKTVVPASAAFFSLQNATTQDLRDTYQKALQKEVSELIGRANQERAKLIDEKEASVQVFNQAAAELGQVQELPGEYLRLAFGVLALALLVVGGGLLAVGLLRLVRKKEEGPTAWFAGAFSCLFACLVLYVVAGHLTLGDVESGGSRVAVRSTAWPEFTADDVKIAGARAPNPVANGTIASSPPQGYFVAQAPQLAMEPQKTPTSTSLRGGMEAEVLAKRTESRTMRAQTFSAVQNNAAQYNMGLNDPERQRRESLEGNDDLRRRFVQAAPKAKAPAPVPSAPSAQPSLEAARGPAAFGGAGGYAADRKAPTDGTHGADIYFREYAHRGASQRGRLDLQDTLLWSPTLSSADGQAQVSFVLSQNLTTYRILVYANSPDGRLGFYEGHLQVRPAAQK